MLSTELGSQAGVSVILVYLLQWLKGSPWFPWLTARTDTINRTLAIVIAFLTSVGFQINMTGNWTSGGTLIIQIPAATAIFSVILHSAAQVGMQEGFYRMAVKPPPEPLLKLSKDDTISVTKG
jgi:hypothetical protein